MKREDIKYAVISQDSEDGQAFLIMQVQHDQAADDENATQAMALFPYGFEANAPAGSLVTLFNIKGQEENKVGVPSFPQERFGDFEPWESGSGNFLSKCRIKFLNNGDVQITATQDLIVDAERDVTINAGGKVTINATSVKVNCDSAVVNSDSIDLAGTGGAGIARIGDKVAIGSGSSSGSWPIVEGSDKVRSN